MFFSHFFFNFWSLSQISVPSSPTILRRICKFRGQFEEWTFRRVGTNFSNSRVFLYVSMNHISHVLMDALLEEKSECAAVTGAGQPGLQSESVGTTWFRRLAEKDSSFEHEQVRYVLQEWVKLQVSGQREKQETATLTDLFVSLMCASFVPSSLWGKMIFHGAPVIRHNLHNKVENYSSMFLRAQKISFVLHVRFAALYVLTCNAIEKKYFIVIWNSHFAQCEHLRAQHARAPALAHTHPARVDNEWDIVEWV